MPREATLADALALTAFALDELVVLTARDTHSALSRRAHAVLRAGAAPCGVDAVTDGVQAVHEGVAGLVYGALRTSLRATSAGLDRLGTAGVGPTLDAGARGRFVRAAVNGLIGEELERDRPHLAINAGVRHEGRDVPLTRAGVTAAFDAPTPRLAVFLHGLCENEDYWRLRRARHGTTYAESLAVRGWTPVFLRTNTGLSLRENGAATSAVLQRLVEAWPGPVGRIALVGHSLGGLVARAATSVQVPDVAAPQRWTDRVSDVVTLGTPHLGSPVARAADRGARALGLLPESRGFGAIIDRRSVGIRDLQLGLGPEAPPLPHARYRLVAATVTRSPSHPVARLVGDLLVTPGSAAGRDPRRGVDLFDSAEVLSLPRTDHIALLNHPDVYPALERWLG
ncbi:hypothetical protein JK386_05645 [Nocardioides sp. zg-536]|uniref:DUF676 domain-containing protein n=1 Tax=Nocardioides faecalis TaxID=2803858 RepID=A0A938Y513_9ACTN|nr:hypothetical protein [Nocardioides faecalis]MBM9459380.1 hypothetical protein [Nocardioides faecalis]QVI59511.1 hypothetical protein KG111_03870 [Nocardioides faecalis]